MGRRFANMAQFLAHRKAATHGDDASAARALLTPDPAAACALGRQVTPYDEARWSKYWSAWCEDGLWRQFTTHAELGDVLLDTGDRPIVECRADGANPLGTVLMRVRARLHRYRAIATNTAALPWQCDVANGGVDWNHFADLLECYCAATSLRDREPVCSRTGARWQDYDLIEVLRRIPTEGGVAATQAAVDELDRTGSDRIAGPNGRMNLEELLTSCRVTLEELEAGFLEGPFRERAELGPDPVWVHPVHLVDKCKDGKPKFKATIDFLLGLVRDGEYGSDLQRAKRWIDNMSAGRVAALGPDGRKLKSKPALDSLNAFSPLTQPCTLDDVPFLENLIMRLKTDGGRLSGAAKRHVEGSATDIKQAYRNVPLKQSHRRLFCFRFLDVTKPIPQYVLDGEQPRDEDLVYYRKTVLPFGWISSVDYWVRISKALKALHMWDECPGLTTHIPRSRRPDGTWAQRHGIGTYIDDSGIFAERGWGQTAQARYIELCTMLGVPISQEKLRSEGQVSPVVAILGVLADCDNEELRLSPERLATLAQRCREMIGKSHVTQPEMRNLVGVLSFAASCAPAGRTFMRRLYQAAARKGKYCRLNRGLKCDLAWWLRFVLEDGGWHGKSMMIDDFVTRAEELGLFTDASLTGFGATFILPDGTCEVFSGRWADVLPGIDTSQATKEWSISELELLVVVMAMVQWSHHLTQRRIIMRCDNEAAVHAINTGRARDGAMSALLRELWFVKARGSFEMRSRHIKTHDNVLGDAPSRWLRSDGSRDRAAVAEFYAHLAEEYGIAASAVREVPVRADTLGLLHKMRKAHRVRRDDGTLGSS